MLKAKKIVYLIIGLFVLVVAYSLLSGENSGYLYEIDNSNHHIREIRQYHLDNSNHYTVIYQNHD